MYALCLNDLSSTSLSSVVSLDHRRGPLPPCAVTDNVGGLFKKSHKINYFSLKMICNLIHSIVIMFAVLITTTVVTVSNTTTTIIPITIFYESDQHLKDVTSSILSSSASAAVSIVKSHQFQDESQFPTKNTILIGNSIPPHFTTEMIIDAIGKGSNLLWIIPSSKDPINIPCKELAQALGRNLHSNTSSSSDSNSSQLYAPHPIVLPSGAATTTFKEEKDTPAVPSYFPHSLSPSNSLVFPVLHSSNPHFYNDGLRGDENVYISALQARPSHTGARPGRSVLVTGDNLSSMTMSHLLDWTFGSRGLMKMQSFTYWTGDFNDEPSSLPSSSVVKDDDGDHSTILEKKSKDPKIGGLLSVKIEMIDVSTLEPFLPDDMYFELTMMDTWVRAKLIPHAEMYLIPSLDVGSMAPKGSIRLPSRYGIYQLRLHYDRLGYHVMGLDMMGGGGASTTNNIGGYYQDITVRDFHHDEKERFWVGALPYYCSLLLNCVISVGMVFPLLIIEKKRRLLNKA